MNTHKNALSRSILEVNDILITIAGTLGRTAIVSGSHLPLNANQAVSIVRLVNAHEINLKYIVFALNAPSIAQSLIGQKKITAIPNLTLEIIANCLLPIPPIAEQERIVKEIERFEPLLADYDKLEQQATKLDNEIYDKLKKSILQYAIQGKLVEQDEYDEPASVLLERIRAEKKTQLGKKYVESYIYKGDDNCYYEHICGKDVNITEEIPFDLPNGWVWSRISEISNSYIGLTYKPNDIVQSGGNIVLRSSNIQDGKIDLTDIVRVNVPISEKLSVKKNDIIICARNGSKRLVGKSALVDIEMENLTFGAFMAICKTPLYSYVAKFLLSQLFFEQLAGVKYFSS